MKLKHRLFENWRSALAAASISILIGWVFLIFGIGESLTDLSFDIPFVFRRIAPPDDVVIIYMDEESHRRLGQPRFDLWDRSLHARILDRLRSAGCRAVVFDIRFDTTNDPSADRALVDAVRAQGKVAVAATVGDFIFNRRQNGIEPLEPFPALKEAAAAWGIVERSDGENSIRKHYQGEFNIPSLSWKVAALTMSNPPPPDEPRWMNYYGPRMTIPHESFVHVLSNTVPNAVFSNKVVYIGAGFAVPYSGGKDSDDFVTPYTRWAPHWKSSGVEVNATAYLNLAHRDWLRRPSPVAELFLFGVGGLMAGCGLTRFRPLVALNVGILAAFLVATIGCLLPRWLHWWFPWMILAVVQLPIGVLCSAAGSFQRVFDGWKKLEKTLATTPEGANGVASREGASESKSDGLLTAEVLRHMTLLRATSGLSPNSAEYLAPRPLDRILTIPDYQLLQEIGRGAYGEVWLAKNVMGRYRAIKMVFRKNFLEARPYEREFEGIRRFEPISRSHPGLVQILHAGRDDLAGYYYYVMEPADDALRGQEIEPATYAPKTLAKLIKEQGPSEASECLHIAEALTLALDFLHGQGLIHRDIKPSNIIFVHGEPKLADIGLVTDIGDNKTFVGTAGYFPSEGPGTPSADLYSLGKVLYGVSTGFALNRFPELPSSFNDGTPARTIAELNKVILKACEINPRKRYQTAQEMFQDLKRIGDRRPGWFGRSRS